MTGAIRSDYIVTRAFHSGGAAFGIGTGLSIVSEHEHGRTQLADLSGRRVFLDVAAACRFGILRRVDRMTRDEIRMAVVAALLALGRDDAKNPTAAADVIARAMAMALAADLQTRRAYAMGILGFVLEDVELADADD